MLIHQGWFTALYIQHLLDSQSLELEICIFPREAIPSHYFPLREDSSRVLAWGLHGYGKSCPGVVIIPPLPPNVTNGRDKPQWKSMLIHQGWFTALYTQHLLDSQSLELEICIFPREAISSHLLTDTFQSKQNIWNKVSYLFVCKCKRTCKCVKRQIIALRKKRIGYVCVIACVRVLCDY